MRDYRLDNVKCLLIYLVVFGRLLEQVPGQYALWLYETIYLFHMPAFIFITGYFAKFKRERVLQLLLMYAVFQTLYLLWDWLLFGQGGPANLQYITPYWLLWYLLACVMYYLLVPLLETKSTAFKVGALVLSVCVALAVGYCDGIDRTLTLSRLFAFLPFFVAGYYARGVMPKLQGALLLWQKLLIACVCALGVAGGVALVLAGQVNTAALYAATSYAVGGYSAGVRAAIILVAACWIGPLLLVAPKGQVPLVSYVGKHTLPIFLLHGFVLRAFTVVSLFNFGTVANVALAAVLACVIVAAFGNTACEKLVRLGR